MIDDDDIIRGAEGARILGIDNPLNNAEGDVRRDEFSALLEAGQGTAAGVAAMLIKLADFPADQRQAALLATQDGIIHLLIEVHTLLHLLPR